MVNSAFAINSGVYGNLRALAVTSLQRSTLMVGVPTVAEQGMPEYELDQWHGLLAPANTSLELAALPQMRQIC